MFRVHLQLYQSLVIAQCNMFRNFEDKHWQVRYLPYRTVRDSGTCWSVPFWSGKSPRTVSRPALHDACLGSICESSVHLDCVIYIIISQNIRYLLWNRGFCRSLNNTYPIFLIPCIRCTNHLCDSCDLTDVNPHFIPSLLRKIQNVELLWRHRY